MNAEPQESNLDKALHEEHDRQMALREDKEKRFVQLLMLHAIDKLTEEERLGEPYRDGNRIIIPIMKPEEHGGRHDVDPVSLHALMEAWLNESSG